MHEVCCLNSNFNECMCVCDRWLSMMAHGRSGLHVKTSRSVWGNLTINLFISWFKFYWKYKNKNKQLKIDWKFQNLSFSLSHYLLSVIQNKRVTLWTSQIVLWSKILVTFHFEDLFSTFLIFKTTVTHWDCEDKRAMTRRRLQIDIVHVGSRNMKYMFALASSQHTFLHFTWPPLCVAINILSLSWIWMVNKITLCLTCYYNYNCQVHMHWCKLLCSRIQRFQRQEFFQGQRPPMMKRRP